MIRPPAPVRDRAHVELVNGLDPAELGAALKKLKRQVEQAGVFRSLKTRAQYPGRGRRRLAKHREALARLRRAVRKRAREEALAERALHQVPGAPTIQAGIGTVIQLVA